MKGTINEILAPTTAKQREPISGAQSSATELKYTIWGTRSGPKPDYLLKAEQAAAEARADYDWLIHNGVHHEGALTEAWDAFTIAENKRRDAWEAYQDGLDFVPCEF